MTGRDSILFRAFFAYMCMFAPAWGYCNIECVFIQPGGAITSADTISFEIYLTSSCTGRPLAQPAQVSVEGNLIAIDVFPDEVGLCFPAGAEAEGDYVVLGSLAPGEYTYRVTQHGNSQCDERVVVGSFCVQDILCIGPWCECHPRIARYRVRELNPEWMTIEFAQGVNDLGHIVGRAYNPEGKQVAFIDVEGERSYLGTLLPDDSFSSAFGVNSHGEVVGYSFKSQTQTARAVLWKDGVAIDLGTLGKSSYATAINDAGEIVGWSVSDDGTFPVYWSSGSAANLTVLGDAPGRAMDINESGVVVGGAVIDGEYHAALWRDGVVTDLGWLGSFATALGINEVDQVVGESLYDDSTSWKHAFLWEDGVLTDLGVLWGFERCRALAINDGGQILGDALLEGVVKGYLYDPELGVQWLQYVMAPGEQCMDFVPYDLGDGGHIVGHREIYPLEHQGAALLTPLAAPENTPMIPAASFWGVVALMVLVLTAGTIVLYRRAAWGGRFRMHGTNRAH